MEQTNELQDKFFKDTGTMAINSQGEPDIDYVAWLEKLVEEKVVEYKKFPSLDLWKEASKRYGIQDTLANFIYNWFFRQTRS